MDPNTERTRLVEEAVADIRAIEAADGVTRESLERILARLVALAAQADLFNLEAYPPPPEGDAKRSCLYRISEDDDHRFALYLNASRGGYGTPAHNHTTWAVIAGVTGADELNRFYERTDEGGVRQTGERSVRAGTGVAFLPDDLHSIHIDAPLLNFHMYGLGLEQLHRREYYRPDLNRWQVFPPHSDIREARGGRSGAAASA
jgi:predicted metal-dependent enzyme (double-stranded beta helix superfamily)